MPLFNNKHAFPFRSALGDNETLHEIQFTDPTEDSYCDR